ncbi:MAG: ATP-binding protein [Ginsengibacter sp.]
MVSVKQSPFSSFNFFEALFNNSVENNILLLDQQGKIITVNKAFTDCFGYTHEDLEGKDVEILFTEEDQKKRKPEKEIATTISQGQASDNNYLVKKDKTIVWVLGESVLVQNETGENWILKIIQNVNREKLNEKSALQFSNLNENILAAIDDVVIVMDEKLNILKTNHAFAFVFNEPDDKNKKRNFADLIASYDPDQRLIARIKDTLKSKTSFKDFTLEIESPLGENRFYDFHCSPLLNAEDTSVLLVIHDITIYKQIEKEREDVIGFVAHELRNPLANLILCNDLMKDAIKKDTPSFAVSLLQRSKNNIFRLNKMIAELYEATRVNSGNLKLDKETFQIGEMIRESIETVEVLQPSYHITVRGDGNLMITGDRYRLIQVVTNFIGNGIKYSNGKKDVVLTIDNDNTAVTVSVKDEGLGISAENLPHVFKRFFRAEETKSLDGIGLGLYLCQQIIFAHQGKIWAESEEGKGSTFYFSIPSQENVD